MTAKIEVLDATITEPPAVNLDQLAAQGVNGAGGLMRIPGRRGNDIVIPGAHGELHVPNKLFDAGDIVLPLWVRGANPDGTFPTDAQGCVDEPARLAIHARARALADLFAPDLVKVRHTLTDDTAREITCEVTDVMNWTLKGGGRNTLGLVTVGLHTADPFWTDLADTVQTVTLASGAAAQLDEFDGASAPMENLQVVFGPSSNPRLQQPATQVFVGVGRVITPAQTITVDTGQFQVYGTSGVAPHLYEDLSYGGRGTSRWFMLRPEPGGPVVKLTHTGGGTAPVTVRGRRRFRIA